MTTPILVANDVAVSYGTRTLFEDVNLVLHAGEVIAVQGRSGAGKTTLLACLAGLRLPSSGSIELTGRSLTAMSARQRARYRLGTVGFVAQDADLLPELTPLQNVALPALLAGTGATETERTAAALVDEVGVRCPPETSMISGGEAQRLALARAMITEPALLIADEPTASMDARTRDEVLDAMLSRAATRGMAIVLATHDPDVALRANRTIHLGEQEC